MSVVTMGADQGSRFLESWPAAVQADTAGNMNRASLASILGLSLGLTACATSSSPVTAKHATQSVFDAKAVAQYAFGGKSDGRTPFDPRKPGDFAVFRVSG